jgi:hypothetical protein
MVQPTRIVCCACDALAPANTEATAPAAKIHFEDIRILPTPFFRCHQAALQINLSKLHALSLSWFKQSGKPPEPPARCRQDRDLW